VRDVGFGAAVERAFVDVDLVDLDVDRRALDFPSPIGSASPTALIAPPATSPTVSTILPAALPTVSITLGAIGECLQRSFDQLAAHGRLARPVPMSHWHGHNTDVTISDERRLVTVLFADMVGFSGRAESADPEEVRELQRSYFGAVASEIERYGGSVEKYIGDAAMALFGAPQAHDDDAERALRAAIAIREAVGALDGGLEVRIGVNTGEVVGGPGGPQQGEYSVSGDAVNVAARLQQSAGPSEILAGGMTRRLASGAFEFTRRDPMAVKGRTEPVEAWSLAGALAERPRVRGGEAQLVGRERELAALQSALEEAREGRGLMVALVGEPGIGKSRLAHEIARQAETSGFATAWTSSPSYASAFPYHLAGQLVPQLLKDGRDGTDAALRAAGVVADEDTIETWARVLDDVLGTASDDATELRDLSPAGKQRILVHALGALLRAGSTSAPILLVLDDLHWADPASLAVVEELLTTIPELRVALLATYRSNWSHGWEGRSAYEQINLRPLRPEDARRMAAELATGRSLPDELTEQVLERSAGNPLFLEELLHGDRGADGGEPRRLPASIHEMLLARLDALPGESRRVLQLASVVGMEFDERVLADLAETDPEATDDALRSLQRAELVQVRGDGGGDRSYAFRHPLIHEVAYGSLVTSARREIHGRVGTWLEAHGAEDRVAELARHFDHSDDQEKARRYLRLAGERAHDLNASREAFEWFRAAADACAEDPLERGQLLEAAAQEIYLLGETDEATRIQEEAIAIHEAAGNDRAAANARIWLGRYIWLLGDPVEAERQNVLAVDGLERYGPSPELAMAYSFRAQSLMLVPVFDESEHWARKAIEVAEATGATGALVHATNNLGTSLLGKDDAEGIRLLRQARELALEHHLPDEVGRANSNLASQGGRIFPMSYQEMDDHLVQGTEYARRTIPDGIFDRWVRAARGEFLLMTGRWEEAEHVLFGLDTEVAEAYLRSEALSLRGLLYAYRGRYDEAAAMTADVPETALKIADLQAVLPALVAQAVIKVGLEDDAGALEMIRLAIERRGDTREGILSIWTAFEVADAFTAILLRAPDSAALRDGLELMAAFCVHIAHDALARGDLVQVEVRHALFGAAVEQLGALARRTGTPVSLPDVPSGRSGALPVLDREHRLFDAARIRLWLAEESDGSAELSAAVATFEEVGAHPYLARAHRRTA
jgi:adenylate cyclase